jgi:hypothetical protein
MSYSYDRSKTRTAAVAKVPLYGKFETKVSLAQIEKLVDKHYQLVPGSLKWTPGLNSYPSNNRGEMFFDFSGENATDPSNYISGSVIIALERNGDEIRSYAYIRIDG